jgi:integrase
LHKAASWFLLDSEQAFFIMCAEAGIDAGKLRSHLLECRRFNQGLITNNPWDSTKAGGQTKQVTKGLDKRRLKIQESNNHVYGLDEVADFLNLPNPAKTVCAVAGFTGLTRSELRGFKWPDYDGKEIRVQRKVIDKHDYSGESALKTEAREGAIPVIPQLRAILDEYKREFPPNDDGWVFRGEKLGRPLDLNNISRRVIPALMPGAWYGWHAFRRGLGTRLNDLGVDAKTIQTVHRHANVSTTQAYYILPDKTRAEAGMAKLAKVFAKQVKSKESRRLRSRSLVRRRNRVLR